jgi:uncharacterized membrane protein YbaN (DUF454 family)
MKLKRVILLCCGWLAFVAGIVGVFVPVLPTTPFLLLATFLFANSSPRWHAWIQKTKVYQRYVVPFKEGGGIPLAQKIKLLLISFALMGISAWAAPKIYVWIILILVALWLLYLMFVRIPTIPAQNATKEKGD